MDWKFLKFTFSEDLKGQSIGWRKRLCENSFVTLIRRKSVLNKYEEVVLWNSIFVFLSTNYKNILGRNLTSCKKNCALIRVHSNWLSAIQTPVRDSDTCPRFRHLSAVQTPVRDSDSFAWGFDCRFGNAKEFVSLMVVSAFWSVR